MTRKLSEITECQELTDALRRMTEETDEENVKN